MNNEDKRTRFDLETYQEEADDIIVQVVLKSIGEAHQVTVISDDTYVFVLLQVAGLDVPLSIESPSKEMAILDIKATRARHRDIIDNLLPAHALSGCGIVAS